MKWEVIIGNPISIEDRLNKLQENYFVQVHGISMDTEAIVVVVSLQEEYKEFDK
ncbi:MAG: hypothetical protein PF440_00285 [Thiomicrorhabdus sp.]|jgi:hypothetical protein|nr:hypothetical protein [Thiomicrorhabdus sp.]